MDMSDVQKNLQSLYEYNVMLRDKLVAAQSQLRSSASMQSSQVKSNGTWYMYLCISESLSVHAFRSVHDFYKHGRWSTMEVDAWLKADQRELIIGESAAWTDKMLELDKVCQSTFVWEREFGFVSYSFMFLCKWFSMSIYFSWNLV